MDFRLGQEKGQDGATEALISPASDELTAPWSWGNLVLVRGR